jgi:hypothetical protein
VNPPFTTDEFLAVFARYNLGVWPAQVLSYVLAAAVLWWAWRPRARSGLVICGALALMWAWMGIVYHAVYFSRINPAAYLFAGAFLLQSALLLHAGVSRGGLSYRPRADLAGVAGAVLAAYALVVYPGIGYTAGQRYPATPTFGLPCPTVIFTLGVLSWATPRIPLRLLIVPTLWAMLGISAARLHGIAQDYALPVAAVIVCGIAVWSRSRRQAPRTLLNENRPSFRDPAALPPPSRKQEKNAHAEEQGKTGKTSRNVPNASV